MREWWNCAIEASVVKRALKTAILVGGILIAINHGDAILLGKLGMDNYLKMALTVIVPYLVSTSSSVSAIKQHRTN